MRPTRRRAAFIGPHPAGLGLVPFIGGLCGWVGRWRHIDDFATRVVLYTLGSAFVFRVAAGVFHVTVGVGISGFVTEVIDFALVIFAGAFGAT